MVYFRWLLVVSKKDAATCLACETIFPLDEVDQDEIDDDTNGDVNHVSF